MAEIPLRPEIDVAQPQKSSCFDKVKNHIETQAPLNTTWYITSGNILHLQFTGAD